MSKPKTTRPTKSTPKKSADKNASLRTTANKKPATQEKRLQKASCSADALNMSELRYRSLFENMLDGYAYCRMMNDKSGRPIDFLYLSVNSAFERLTGLSNVIGKKVSDVIPGIRESHPELLETYGRVAATGKTEAFEIEFKPLNMWLHVSVYSTEADHFTAVFDNITERKNAEMVLGRSEEKYRLLFENMGEGFALYELLYDDRGAPADWRVLEVNDAYVLHTGISRDRIAGRRMSDLYPEIIPEYLPRFAEVVATQRSVQFETFSKITNRHHHIVSFPAGPNRFANTITDITRRKLSDEATIQSKQTFVELVEHAPFGIYTVDSEFRIAQMNVGSQNGAFRNVRPVIGRDFSEAMRILWPEPVAAEIVAHFRHTLDTGEPYYSPRFTSPRNDAQIVESYEWELHRLMLPDGHYGVICYYYDSTKLRVAEQALRQSEERIQLALRVSRSFTFDWQPVSDMVVRSESCVDILRLSGDEAIHDTGKHFFERVHPDDRGRFLQVLNGLRPAADSYITEYRVLRGDGSTAVLEETGRGSFDDTGKLTRLTGVSTDITERKLAEDALREREQKYRTLIDRMIDGFALHEIVVDASGLPRDYRFIEVNKAFERLTGLRGADIVGKCVTEVLPDIRESNFDWINAYGKVALTGVDLRTEQYSEELGTWYSITSYSPQKGFFVTIFEDITERKRIEKELLLKQEDLDRAQEVGNIGSWRLDVRRNVLTWSDENHRIFGIAKGTPLTYESFLSTIHPDDRATVDARWNAALGGAPYDIEHRLMVDGREKWVREKAYLEFDKDGSLVGGFGITQDITGRKNIEEELRRSLDRSRSYIDVTGQLAWTTTAEGKVEDDIPSWRAYTGQSYDAIKGWGWSQAVHPDDLERISLVWSKAVATKKPYEAEYRIRRHDGVYRDFLARGIPLLHKEGSVREWVGTCVDITDRKNIEKALQKAHDELDLRVQERTRELTIANEATRTERQRLYGVLETLPVYVILLDKDHRIPFANRFFRQRFGEADGGRCYEYLFNRTEPCENCETYTVMKTNEPHHWHWTGPDGRFYDIYDYPFIDSDGSRLILEMGIDITDQKNAQDELNATITEVKLAEHRTALINQLLILFTRETDRKSFLDAAIEVIGKWSGCHYVGIRVTDEQGRIPYESCLGFSDEFLNSERTLSLEQDFCACTRVVRKAPGPQDRLAMTAGGSFYSNNTVQFMERLTEEQRGQFRGACMRSGFLSLAVVPIRYRDKMLGAIHVADKQEGTVPLAAVEFLEQVALIVGEALFRFSVEQESSRLAAAVESAADAVVVTEPERGTILYVNDSFEQMTGYSHDEAVGKDLHLLDSGRQDQAFYEKLRTDLRRDGVWRGQLINMKKDGTLYFEDCTFSPVRDHSGKVLNYVSVRRDITEKLRLESIAESVSMMDNMGAIFAGVRHEIGNPINNAKIHLSVLHKKLDSLPADRVREYVDRTLAEISRVEHLLHTIKTFNLFETPVIEDVATGPLLELFHGLVREDLDARGITLFTQILPGAERLRGNARALQHVLLNVVANASDALKGRPEPHIDITFSREDDRVRLRISDNGNGMTGEQQANLFKPFTTTKTHGTGLGLVIVKKMLTTLQGTIDIASHAGSGTVVTIHLPGGNHAGTAQANAPDHR